MDNKEREALRKIITKLLEMEYNIISVDYAISQLYEYNIRYDSAFSRIDYIRRLYDEIIEEIKSNESLREIYNEAIEQRNKELIKALEEITERLPKSIVSTILALELTKFIANTLKRLEKESQRREQK
jgi:hypothetical protein